MAGALADFLWPRTGGQLACLVSFPRIEDQGCCGQQCQGEAIMNRVPLLGPCFLGNSRLGGVPPTSLPHEPQPEPSW